MNQNSKEKENSFQIPYKKNYIIEINKDSNNTKLIITIALNNTNNITHIKSFSFEDIQNIDYEFFIPFQKNILILYKYIIRLLRANLFGIEANNGKKENILLCLYCLKNNKLRNIKINIPSIKCSQENGIINNENNNIENINNFIFVNNNDSEEDNINKDEDNNNKGDAPAAKIKKKKNKIEYNIKINKILNIFKNTKEYKEIEITIEKIIINGINEEKNITFYYDYLDSQDIFDASIPYYNLFDFSIDDVYDDLNIIFYHKNYRCEIGKDFIKLFFKVFNFGEGNPYIEIFIQALNRKRTNDELLMKMNTFFDEFKKVNTDKSIKIKNKNKNEKDINNKIQKDSKIKINKENYSQNFLKSFLKLNNNIKTKENKKIINISNKKDNNNPIKNEITSIKNNDNSLHINNNQKNIKYENISSDINQNNQNIFNNYKKEDNSTKIITYLNYINHKRYNDPTLENFFYKEGNNEFEKAKYNKKENNDINLDENNSLKLEENENEEKNVKNISKKNNMKKETKSNNMQRDKKIVFKMDSNKCYNIDKDSVINNYLSLLYLHPLDNDDEFEKIRNIQEEELYLCNICKYCFKSRDEVREHQWDKHLKPFGEIIQKRLLNLKKNKNLNE